MVTTPTSVRGMSTIELLIAFAVLTLSLTAVVSMVFGNQSVGADTVTYTEALGKAQKLVEQERALALSNFLSITSSNTSETSGGLTFTKTLAVTDLSPCAKAATSTVSWSTSPFRTESVSLPTIITDITSALLMGGDCFINGPTSGWRNPQRFAADTFSPGKPLALDVLDRIAYVAEDKTPFLEIANTKSATLGQSGGLFLTYTNGFAAAGQINALDTINWTNPATGAKKIYLFAAMNSSSNQLAVIDVTTPTAPSTVATLSLSSCVTGSFPQGWYVVAYGNRLYMVVRETAGPELHVFDISTPSSPTELSVGSATCKGYELTDTVEQMTVRDQVVNGVTKRYLYLATDESNQEIRVLDVTDPLNITQVTNVDLPGNQDAMSLYAIGNKLYVGRQSATGADLYVYDISTPPSGLTLLGSKDIGTDVLGIRVTGNFAFLATGKTNQEFQVWNIGNLSNITNIAVYNFGNIVGSGIDYEPDYIYATGQSTPNFQILYSP